VISNIESKIESKKFLPFWWMAAVEICLIITAIWALAESKYIESILIVILIELRDIVWQLRTGN